MSPSEVSFPTDAKLRKVQQFLEFYFSPWGAAKGEQWEQFVSGHRNIIFGSHAAHTIVNWILAGVDEFQWEALSPVD